MNVLQPLSQDRNFIPIWQEEQIYFYTQENARNDIFISYRNHSESKKKKYDTTYI